VAIAVHKKWIKIVEEVRELSGRNMTVILNTGSGKLAMTATYGPTAEASEKNKNLYWEELSREMEHNKDCIKIVAGDFNARLYEIQADETKSTERVTSQKGLRQTPGTIETGLWNSPRRKRWQR